MSTIHFRPDSADDYLEVHTSDLLTTTSPKARGNA